MKDFKKEFEQKIYYELNKDPKIKELQEKQRVNDIKAYYYDLFSERLSEAVNEGISSGYNCSFSSHFGSYTIYEGLYSLYVVPCEREIFEDKENDI